MKPSNLVTPRSLGECHFIPSHDPIERPDHRPVSWFTVISWVLVVVASALLLAAAR